MFLECRREVMDRLTLVMSVVQELFPWCQMYYESVHHSRNSLYARCGHDLLANCYSHRKPQWSSESACRDIVHGRGNCWQSVEKPSTIKYQTGTGLVCEVEWIGQHLQLLCSPCSFSDLCCWIKAKVRESVHTPSLSQLSYPVGLKLSVGWRTWVSLGESSSHSPWESFWVTTGPVPWTWLPSWMSLTVHPVFSASPSHSLSIDCIICSACESCWEGHKQVCLDPGQMDYSPKSKCNRFSISLHPCFGKVSVEWTMFLDTFLHWHQQSVWGFAPSTCGQYHWMRGIGIYIFTHNLY